MSNHLQILQAVGCSAEIGKEGQLSRYIDFNLLEDLASQRSQPGFFQSLATWELATLVKLLLSTCPYLEKGPEVLPYLKAVSKAGWLIYL